MKTLEQLVNKKFDKKLLDFKSYKKKLDKMRALVKEYNIPCVLKSDSDCFYVEMLYHSLLNKRKLILFPIERIARQTAFDLRLGQIG